MPEETAHTQVHTNETRSSRAWAFVERLFETGSENIRRIVREFSLFFGTTLTVLGVLNWSSGKYCDGNTADYLSCTNPTTYYYYSAFGIALILVGILLILLWYTKNRGSK